MLKLRFFSLPFAFFLLFTSATFAENAEQRSAQGASALQFRILAVQDASDSAEARAVQLAQSPENADAWTVALSADEQDGVVKGATWIPVDPALEDVFTGISWGREVTRPSQAKEIEGQAKPTLDVLTLDLVDIYNVDGDDLAKAQRYFNDMMTPGIALEMTPDGAEQMRALTTKYVDRQLGGVVNGHLLVAPFIGEPIGKDCWLTFGHLLSEDDCQRIQKEIDLLLDELQAAGVKIGRDQRHPLLLFPSFGSPLFAFGLCCLSSFVGLLVWLLRTAPRRRSPNVAGASAGVNASNNFVNANNSAGINASADFNNSAQFADSANRND